MSAYIMDIEDFRKIGRFIDAHAGDRGLFAYKHFGRPRADHRDNYTDGQRAAQIMLRENVRSVNYRYSERTHVGEVPPVADAYLPTPGEMLELISCWDYQSCERRDYHRSEAYSVYVSVLKLTAEVAARRSRE